MSGRHRGDGARGISTSVIVVVVALLLLVVAVFGWFQLRERIDRQGADAAATCVEGDAVLRIAADPLIAPTLTTLADRWSTDVAPVIRDHCVTAQVFAAESAPVAESLGADTPWNAALGPGPALWVPLDSRAAERATTAVDGQARSLATSPVVLAVPDDLGRA
ncbi:MAG: substrate-binding domain-containing protein, partial [Rhodococcus sp. (in: high G+C Gram-positive bacteria)]